MKDRDLFDLLKKMVSIPSPSGEEHALADFLQNELELPSDEIETVDVRGCAPSIVARHRAEKKGAPTVVLNGHMDTVHVAEGWTKDPFKVKVEGNKMYGLGIGDMKAGLAIMVDVFKRLKKERGLNLVLTAVSDEEGNSLGSYTLIQEGRTEGDVCLIPEPTNELIMMGCRGRYVVDITVIGKAAHGARPHLGINAIEDGARVVNHISRIKPRQHELLGRGSLCVLKIWGGGDTLSVPDRCVIRVDRHVVPGETKEMVMDDFVKTLKDLDIMSEISFSWMDRPTPFLEPYITQRTEPVKAFVFEHKDHIDTEENIVYGESVGDFNLFGKIMPTIVCGPAGREWHSPDEYVLKDSITRIRDLYLDYLRKMAK